MKSCDPNVLSLYLDKELPLPESREVQQHLAICKTCRKELESLKRVDNIVESWGKSRTPLPVRTEARIRKSVSSRRHFRPLLALSRVMPAALGSSIAALLVLVSASQGWLYRTPTAQNTAAASVAVEKIIKKQSAPLYKARATSAMFGVRSNSQTDQAPRRHTVFEVE
jgi:anti-sigma factor RsiW